MGDHASRGPTLAGASLPHSHQWDDHLRVPGFRLALEDVAEALPRTCLAGLTRRTLVLCADAVEMLLPEVLRVIVIGKSGTLELYISTSSLETGKSMYCIDLNVDG